MIHSEKEIWKHSTGREKDLNCKIVLREAMPHLHTMQLAMQCYVNAKR